MRSLLARLAVLGAFAVSTAACSNGNGTSLPFAGTPNSAGGSPGTIATGSNSQALVRFINGSPDYASVDVCIDQLPFASASASTAYGKVAGGTGSANGATGLVSVAGGVPHTIAVFPPASAASGGSGAECQTAPGPYFGSSAIAVTTITGSATAGQRLTVILAGTAAGGTRGLYVYTEPSFATAPAGAEVIAHNAAPTYSKGKSGVGFGYTNLTVPQPTPPPTPPATTNFALTGATNVAAPKASAAGAATLNAAAAAAAINAVPMNFFAGPGNTTGMPPTPVAATASLQAAAGQPYVVELYAYDAPAGGLALLAVQELTLGYGF